MVSTDSRSSKIVVIMTTTVALSRQLHPQTVSAEMFASAAFLHQIRDAPEIISDGGDSRVERCLSHFECRYAISQPLRWGTFPDF